MTDKPTPRPWRVVAPQPGDKLLFVVGGGPLRPEDVAQLDYDDVDPEVAEANAAMIVLAVNCHADLVEALENIRAKAHDLDQCGPKGEYGFHYIEEDCLAALALVADVKTARVKP